MKKLYPGDRGTLVQYVQLALTRAGHPAKIDGIFGDNTCASLQAFFGKDTPCQIAEPEWEALIPYLKGYTTHRATAGDSYWQIASRYHSSVQRLVTANPTIDPSSIKIGTVIFVPFHFPLVSDEVDYSSYLTDWILEGLLVRYPFLRQKQIGSSVMGRELTALQIGEGSRQVFYNASFHANEWITTPVLLKFAEDFAEGFASGTSLFDVRLSWLYYGYTLFLVPLVNPDGVDLVTGVLNADADMDANGKNYFNQAKQIGANYPKIPFPQGWKANIEGIDLNLQFPAGWERAKEIKYAQGFQSPAPRDYVGPFPLSAPESKAVYDFTQNHDFQLILAYHTQGEVIYWKYQDYEPENSYRIARYFHEVSGYTVEETPKASGNAGYKDWFIQTYNRPGYTIEAGRGNNPLPMSQFSKIYQDNLGILMGGMTELTS